MNEQTADMAGRIEELLDVLERDMTHIEYAVSKLNDLRGFVIKRDEQGLVRLLGEIREETMDYQANEDRRGVIQKELAGLFGCQPRELTLSVLKKRVSGAASAAIGESQEKLKKMVGRLRVEYISTAALLSECSRINSALLRIVFNRSGMGPACYGSNGLTTRESEAAFMNMRL
jgi:hypothetical protein